jgi:hypothetical protein
MSSVPFYRHVFLLCTALGSSFFVGVGSRPAQAATTDCAYPFGVSGPASFLAYCVTENGNILQIETPQARELTGPGGEGYGVCQESPATEYHDYAVEDSGNWDAPVLVSRSTNSVKIARTTSDGSWVLRQTISLLAAPPAIKVVMVLKNNLGVPATAYMVRYADYAYTTEGKGQSRSGGSPNSIVFLKRWWSGREDGLLLEDAGTQRFGFRELLIQKATAGPNPCAWAYNATGSDYGGSTRGGLIAAYAGLIPSGGTRTATMFYRGM